MDNMQLRVPAKLLLLAIPLLPLVIAVMMLTHPVEESSISSALNKMYDSTLKPNLGSLRATTTHAAVNHHAWTIKETEYVPEHKINVVTYTHKKTLGELVSIHWDESETVNPREQEKVFSIFFRTPVADSTGVPHILEHSVLCGSEKFKTKEPFADINQKSLNTFLNAFTWDDRTGFAFASCNTQDFWNSLDVYLDAVFHPRVRHDRFVLAQEGWHLSPVEGAAVNESGRNLDTATASDADVSDIELKYSGVVYSEMKGVYSDPSSSLYRKIQEHTFPDTSYKFDSGGDPKEIPTLTFEKFGEFYDKYYHPSNARTFVSGLDSTTERDFLTKVDEYYNGYDAAPEKKTASEVKMQPKNLAEPIRKSYGYPVEDGTHMVATSWLINDQPISAKEHLAWRVLSRLLLGASSSILYKTLSESRLGTEVLDFGLQSELIQSTFTIGLKGVQKEDKPKVEKLVLATLRKIAKEGFDEDTIQSSLNFIEFSLRENDPGTEPKGLGLMFASMNKYVYDYSPTEGLKFEESLKQLTEEIKQSNSKVFQDLIQNYLLDNNHRVTVHLNPDSSYEANNVQEEKDRITAYKDNLSLKELRAVIADAEELKRQQAEPNSEEAIASIPTITLADVERSVVEYPITVEEKVFGSDVTLLSSVLPTAGIVYVEIGIDISRLSLKTATQKLPLFIALMTETGTDQLSEVKLREEIEMHTGGIKVGTLISQVSDKSSSDTVVLDGSKWVTKLVIQGKSLAAKSDKLFGLIHTILTQSKLDKKQKAIELLKSSCAGGQSSLASSGNSYAVKRLTQRYNVAGVISEQMGGVTSIEFCPVLLNQVQNDWPTVLKELQAIRTTLLDANTLMDGLIINLNGDEDVMATVRPELQKAIENLPGGTSSDGADAAEVLPKAGTNPVLATVSGIVEAVVSLKTTETPEVQHPWLEDAIKILEIKQAAPVDEAVIVPTQVSYVARGNEIYGIGEKVNGSSEVVTSWLSSVYLWNTVRIQGNAYGARANLDSTVGVFACVSYRDPNIISTLEFYDGVIPWLKEQELEFQTKPKELESAIIGAISTMEGSPPSNSQKGTVAFHRHLLGITTESRQKWRDEVFDAKAKDFGAFATKLEGATEQSTVIVTSNASFDSAHLETRSVVKINVP